MPLLLERLLVLARAAFALGRLRFPLRLCRRYLCLERLLLRLVVLDELIEGRRGDVDLVQALKLPLLDLDGLAECHQPFDFGDQPRRDVTERLRHMKPQRRDLIHDAVDAGVVDSLLHFSVAQADHLSRPGVRRLALGARFFADAFEFLLNLHLAAAIACGCGLGHGSSSRCAA